MSKPTLYAQRKREADVNPSLKVGDWFKVPDCDQVARRHQVWGLLDWYHHNVVVPNQGIPGVFRRLYWRIRGRFDPAYRMKLYSPWEQLQIRMAVQLELAQEEQEQKRRNGA
jgi:hypothetical protein